MTRKTNLIRHVVARGSPRVPSFITVIELWFFLNFLDQLNKKVRLVAAASSIDVVAQ